MKLLGITLQANLGWTDNVAGLVTSLNQRVGLVRRLLKWIPRCHIQPIVDGLVISKLRYGLPVFGQVRLQDTDPTHGNMKKLQGVLNDLMRLVANKRISDLSWSSLVLGFSVDEILLYPGTNATALRLSLDFTEPAENHTLEVQFSKEGSTETLSTFEVLLNEEPVLKWTSATQALDLFHPFTESNVNFKMQTDNALIRILEPSIQFQGDYKVVLTNEDGGKETAERFIPAQYRCSSLTTSTSVSEVDCTIGIALGCKDKLYPKPWLVEAALVSDRDDTFRVDAEKPIQGPTNPDGTFSYILEQVYQLNDDSPRELRSIGNFSFGAVRNSSLSIESNSSFPGFDGKGCFSFEEFCQTQTGQLTCQQENGRKTLTPCRKDVIPSDETTDLSVSFTCPDECRMKLNSVLVDGNLLKYTCDVDTNLWHNQNRTTRKETPVCGKQRDQNW
eukprot:maker-scaffold322_size207131-snap-gene-0.12 protein:Tk09470 transcript:maker-scaffold322_size207131-snap-gene-0.12-mRNA-1 annotation:"unnamed protein product"